jgi:hypothetical protein
MFSIWMVSTIQNFDSEDGGNICLENAGNNAHIHSVNNHKLKFY